MARTLGLVACLASAVAVVAGAVLERAEIPQITVFKIPYASAWTESLAVRANGQILVTLLDKGELWEVDPVAKNGTKLYKFPASELAGITEFAPDKFLAITGEGSVENKTTVNGTWSVWKIDMNVSPPSFDLVRNFESSGTMNGITTISSEIALVSDTYKGAIYALNITTGNYSTSAMDWDTMAPPDGAKYGIDGVQYKNGFVYFTNIQKNTFNRMPVDATTGKQSGNIEVLQTHLMGDDFTFGPDGYVYLGTNFWNSLYMLNADGKGTPMFMANVTNAAACQFGRTAADKGTLYIANGPQGGIVSMKLLR